MILVLAAAFATAAPTDLELRIAEIASQLGQMDLQIDVSDLAISRIVQADISSTISTAVAGTERLSFGTVRLAQVLGSPVELDDAIERSRNRYGLELAALYLPRERRIAVFPAVDRLGPAALDNVVAHELIHVWRDKRGDVGKGFAGLQTHDEMRAFQCRLEGEAVFHSERWLFDHLEVEPDPSLHPMWEDLTDANPLTAIYHMGFHGAEAAWARGGQAALSEWFHGETTAEQCLHPSKWRDEPARLPKISGLKVEGRDQLGELGVVGALTAAGAPADAAVVAGTGWDGDRLAWGTWGGQSVVVWLSAWDRPEDAEQVEALLRRRADGGRVTRQGSLVLLVGTRGGTVPAALVEKLERKLLRRQPVVDVEQSRLTAAAEQRIASHATAAGPWVVYGTRVPRPEGWRAQSVGAYKALVAPAEGGNTSNLIVQSLPLEAGKTAMQAAAEVGTALASQGLVNEAPVERTVGGAQAAYVESEGEMNGAQLHFVTVVVPLADRTVMFTGTFAVASWASQRDTFWWMLDGIEWAE